MRDDLEFDRDQNLKCLTVRFRSKADIEACPRDVRFTPKADIGTQSWNVRFVPKADSCIAAINRKLKTGIA